MKYQITSISIGLLIVLCIYYSIQDGYIKISKKIPINELSYNDVKNILLYTIYDSIIPFPINGDVFETEYSSPNWVYDYQLMTSNNFKNLTINEKLKIMKYHE